MTIDSEINKNRYTATSGQTVFPYDFRILDENAIDVYQNGTLLTLTTHYTLSGVDSQSGGNVTLVTGATLNDKITLLRSEDLQQDEDYIENDAFPAETHEKALDKLTCKVQQQDEILDRTPRLTVDSTYTALTMEDPEAGRFLKWNAGLTGLENSDGGTGSGDVTGPGTSVDNTLPRFAGTTGEVIQSSGIVVDDSDNVTGVGTVDGRDIAADGTQLDTNTTKLAGIEANADVTDYINVSAALAAPSADLVFNESAADRDQRWESTGNTSKFKFDAGNNVVQVAAGTAPTALANIGGRLHSDTVASPTTGTTKETLMSYTLPGNSLSAAGKAIRITFQFTTAANANSKTVTVEFGGQVLYTFTTSTSAASAFGTILVVQQTTGNQMYYTPGTGFETGGSIVLLDSLTLTETGNLAVELTGTTATASGDATANHLLVEIVE